jgi:hypothetical protein
VFVTGTVYVVAATYVDDQTSPCPDPDATGRRDFAVTAAQAAVVQCGQPTYEIRGAYHAATAVPTIPGVNAAADLMAAAKLPLNLDDPLVTIAGGSHGLMAALRAAVTAMDAEMDPTPNFTLITAGDVWPDAPVPECTLRDNAGAALIVSNQPGPLTLSAIITDTDHELRRLVQRRGDEDEIRRRSHQLLSGLARYIDDDQGDISRVVPYDFDLPLNVDHVITSYPPDSDAHHELVAALGARPNTIVFSDAADPTNAISSPLNVIRHLAAIVKDPGRFGRPATILVVSGWETGTASAVLLRLVWPLPNHTAADVPLS